MSDLKRLITAAPKAHTVRVRYLRATNAYDAERNFWGVEVGAELDVTPDDARRAVASGDAMPVERIS